MLLSYLRLVLFAIGLLVGVQVPGFVNDYAKRVEAHLIEAQTGSVLFERAADDEVLRADGGLASQLPLQVLDPVLPAFDEIGASGLAGTLDHLRIG